MAQKHAAPVGNEPKPDQQPKSKITPPQWFGRLIQRHAGLQKKGRLWLTMRQLTRNEPMTAGVKYLAAQTGLTPAEVRRYRNEAKLAGWLEPIEYQGRKAFKRAQDDLKESNARWRKGVDLAVNVIVTITDLVSRTDDFKLEISLKALGAKCHAHPVNVGKAITKLEWLEPRVLDVDRNKGGVNTLKIPIESKPKRVTARQGAGLTSQEVLAQGKLPARVVNALTEIIQAAKSLNLIDLKTEGELSAHILELYGAVVQERDAAKLSDDVKIKLGGPLEIMRRYIAWLQEKGWEASSKVLRMESKPFAQFRRDFRTLEGVDPIDGKERRHG